MNSKIPFSISPGTGVMDVLGHSGYSFNFAIADLIDNCISAEANNIMVHFEIPAGGKEPYLYILDDGKGMSEDDLQKAAIIGFKGIEEEREAIDLGRYSTGLKSATKSFCGDIKVSSKRYGEKEHTIEIDYDYIKISKKWEAFNVFDFAPAKLLKEQGTLVYCERLNIFNGIENISKIFSKVGDLEVALSHIFHKYLLSGTNISIQVNDSNPIAVKGWNPFSLPESKATKLIFNKERIEYHGDIISIKAYILPVFNNLSSKDQKYVEGRGLMEQQGFYIYRNKRLIQEGGWLNLPEIGLDDKCKYARIDVDIPSKLDKEFNINFSKNSLEVPNDLVSLFLEVAKKARKESRNNFNYVKHPELKKTVKKDADPIWNVSHSSIGTVLSVNPDHPLIVELCSGLSTTQRKQLFTALSKSLPIGMIQSQEMGIEMYTENEMLALIDEVYKKLSKEGLSLKDIKKKIGSMVPFKDYIDILVKYFDQKIGDEK